MGSRGPDGIGSADVDMEPISMALSKIVSMELPKKGVQVEKINAVEVVFPLAQKCSTVRIRMEFTDEELANNRVLEGKRNLVIDEARKLYESGRVEFMGELAESQPTPVQVPAPVAPSSPTSQSSNPTCKHGERKYKEGIGSNKRPYKAWFCKEPKGPTQCEAIWA